MRQEKGIRSIYQRGTPFGYFLISVLIAGLAFGLYRGMLDNYLTEMAHMNQVDKGISEFFRELPGVMLVLILAAIYMLSAEKVYKVGAVIMMIGMGMHAVLPPSKVLVTLSMCTFALGEHLQMPMKSTLSLQYAKEGFGGRAQGMQNSFNQIGTLIGYIVIAVGFWLIPGEGTYQLFYWVGTALLAGAVALNFGITGKSKTDSHNRRFYIKKKYKKYYMLEMFYGARKQVFLTFAPFTLILFYGASTAQMSLLFAISSVACFLLAPVIGKIIDKVGYKAVMVGDTIILVVVCLMYGFAHKIFSMEVAFIVCCINYVFDAVISMASMASNVYVQDLSDSPEEVKATISTGVSINHIITVFIALFGGWIWQKLGIQTLFIISAILGLCNSAYAASIKMPKKETISQK